MERKDIVIPDRIINRVEGKRLIKIMHKWPVSKKAGGVSLVAFARK